MPLAVSPYARSEDPASITDEDPASTRNAVTLSGRTRVWKQGSDSGHAGTGPQERICRALAPDGRVGPVPRVDDRRIAEREEDVPDRPHERRVVAAGQVSSSDRSRKQRVSHEEVGLHHARPGDAQADPARTVARV